MLSKTTKDGIWIGLVCFIVILAFVETIYPGITKALIDFILFPKVIQ